MKAVEYIAKFLKDKKTEVIFDYPGNPILGLYAALEDASLRHITVRHEQGAVHAAEGYAKSTGKPGVCIATSGPGATNLVTGLCDAMLDSVPLFVITGQVDRASIGHDAFQEADITGITLAVTKHNFLVKDPAALPTVLEEGWRIATRGRKGPVLVDIPCDVLLAELPEKISADPVLPHKRSYDICLENQKSRILNLINKSSRPIILAGGGVTASGREAAVSLERFSLENGVPIVYTMMGKSGIDNCHPNVFGMIGMHGSCRANGLVEKSDLVIAVGTRFSDRSCPDPALFSDKTVIHIDIDAAELCKNVFSICPVVADAGEFARFIAETEFSERKKTEWKSLLPEKEKTECETPSGFSASYAIADIAKILSRTSPDAVIVTDVGRHQLFAANLCETGEKGSFICSGGLGTMGFGLPAAIGAAVAHPEKDIVLFTGDGSFQMCMQELAEIASLSLDNIKIILIDNRSLGLVEQLFEDLYPEREGQFSGAFNPDFSKIAEAYGISYNAFSDRESFEGRIEELLRSGKCELIRLETDPGENAPTHLERKGYKD